ncbi:MAG: MBL fold metallo-hydrolase, partial [Streptomycetales bacterium]
MKLTVVGCSGSFPSAESAASCYLVEAEGFRVLLDLGNGALGALQRHVGLFDVDVVLLSHLHADHCLDLCSYYVARKYHPGGIPPRLPVYGPGGTADRLARAYQSPPEGGVTEVFEFRTLGPGSFDLGPLAVRLDRVNHPVETFATRLEHGGRAVVYSGDTGHSDALVRLAHGADLLLCEASFEEGWDVAPGLHLTGGQAGEHAERAGVGRLV